MPREYHSLLNSITANLQKALGSNLKGVYVHGSICFGSYQPERSDIDFIGLVDKPLSIQEKEAVYAVMVAESVDSPKKGLEMSLVLSEHAKTFTYPPPYELHFSPDYFERYQSDPSQLYTDEPKFDYDLAAHFTVIRQRGICWYGQPIDAAFGPVPWENFLDSLLRDMPESLAAFKSATVYNILNFCRIKAAFTDGLLLSKPEGARWALEKLPNAYHGCIQAALAAYEGSGEAKFSHEDLLVFYEAIDEFRHC